MTGTVNVSSKELFCYIAHILFHHGLQSIGDYIYVTHWCVWSTIRKVQKHVDNNEQSILDRVYRVLDELPAYGEKEYTFFNLTRAPMSRRVDKQAKPAHIEGAEPLPVLRLG
ncbi:MAG: hypothetical protein MN733_33070 [Nitrososphaera sp.]|nr:hypothetical protein [Nitrososphaera sp.]